MVCIYQKNYKDGIPIFKTLIKKDSTSDVFYSNIGMLYTYAEQYELAKTAFQKSIFSFPEHSAFSHSNLGFCFHKLKKYNKAIEHYNKSIELNPKNSWVYKNKALTYIELNMKSEACQYLKLSDNLGYKRFYGSEVDKLLKKYCE